LVSGFYFPVSSLPYWLAVGASLIPLTLGLDAMRQLARPSSVGLRLFPVQVELAVLVGLAVVFIGSSKFALDRMERLARHQGRITERRR
jgi:ABC-2 type transport system permease protein